MKHPDPTVSIVAWSGPLSALSARLGIPPSTACGVVEAQCQMGPQRIRARLAERSNHRHGKMFADSAARGREGTALTASDE